jgi:hypothetical protein
LVWFGFILFCLSSILTINFLSELTIVFTRQLSEKMVLGALLLEGDNYEFWVALGCLSGHNALRQRLDQGIAIGCLLSCCLGISWEGTCINLIIRSPLSALFLMWFHYHVWTLLLF